jgi:hypothetical protein
MSLERLTSNALESLYLLSGPAQRARLESLTAAEVVKLVTALAPEVALRFVNQSSFLLRGKLQLHNESRGSLQAAIIGAVTRVVGQDAASSIQRVERMTANHIRVVCYNKRERDAITMHRLKFSKGTSALNVTADVQQVLQTKLYVDDVCTKQQLQLRHALRDTFLKVRSDRLHPHYRGEVLYYRPQHGKPAVPHPANERANHPAQPAPQCETEQHHEERKRQRRQQQWQHQQQEQQQQQPTQQPGQAPAASTSPQPQQQPTAQHQQSNAHDLPTTEPASDPGSAEAPTVVPTPALPSATSAAVGSMIAEPSTSAAASSILQPTTRGNLPSNQPSKVPTRGWRKKLPAHDPVFTDKIWLRIYKNNNRMKRTAVSILDLHTEWQARQRQAEDSYSGQEVTCTAENKHGVLPERVVADELVSWYASCARGSYSKVVQHGTARPSDTTRWR